MSRDSSWVVVASYSSGIEADMAYATLETAGVPARLQGDRAGILGATFQGTLVHGLALLVPAAEVGRARDVLGLDPTEDAPE